MNEVKTNKLEKQFDKANAKDKNMDEEYNQIVQNYEMKEGDYKILVTIYEASELEPCPANFVFFQAQKSACDAFVQIQVNGQVKKTHVRKQTNNPIWQQSFYFQCSNLSVQELDRAKIVFNVHDKNAFTFNSLIGQFELDWTNVYFRRYHEIYRGWLTLSDPREQIQGPVGYLLVNISVLGPQDKIQVHDSAFIKDPLTTIEDTITNTKVPLIDYSIAVEVYRAESLIPLDLISRNVDAYVVAKFSGNKVKTSVISSLNPEWNQALKIGTGVPNKTKYLILEVRNRNRLSTDDIIGILKIPFIDICEDKDPAPKWGHLYGPPMCAVDEEPSNYATKMQLYGDELGSHYRGRLLYKVIGKKYVKSKTDKNQIKFKFPFKPTPVVPLKTYTLSIQLIEGFQLPERGSAYVQVAIGQYLLKSKLYKVEKKLCEFMVILQDKKVQFPQDPTQVPDVIIYFCDGNEQMNRMSFVRIKAASVVTKNRHKNATIYQLQGDKSLHLLGRSQLGGYLTCRVNLYNDSVPVNRVLQNSYKTKQRYKLFFYLYKGQNFPPANAEGDCDPFIRFNCYGSFAESRTVTGSFNPFWKQRIQMNVELHEMYNSNITKGIVCQIYDHQQNQNHQYIGSFLYRLNSNNLASIKTGETEQVKCLYKKPKWYYAVNPHLEIGKNVFGRVLISAVLVKMEDMNLGQGRRLDNYFINNDLIPTQQKTVQVYVIGLRDIRDSSKKILSKGQASVVMTFGQNQTKEMEPVELKRSGCEINKLVEMKLHLPKNKALTPFVDFKVMNNGKFYGFNSVSLYKLLPKLKEKEGGTNTVANNEESEETILDVEGLQAQLQIIKEKRKKDKLGMNQKEDKMKIQQLPAPLEMGKPIQEIQEKDIEFDNLLKQFESSYQTDQQFQYVRHLEKFRDGKQQDIRQTKLDLNSRIEELFLDKIASHAQEEDRLNILQVIQKQATSRQKQTDNVKGETIFDKLKKNKETIKKPPFNENDTKQQTLRPGLPKIKQESERQNLLIVSGTRKQIGQKVSNLGSNNQSNSGADGQTPRDQYLKTKIKQMEVANSEQTLKKQFNQAQFKFPISQKQPSHQGEMEFMSEADDNIHFDIRTDQEFSDTVVRERAVRYQNVERVMEQEQKDQKEAKEKNQEYRFAQAVKLTLFGWNRKKKRKDIQTYEDYDTDEGEDLNIIPEWYKGRKILATDLEDLNFKSNKIQTVPLFAGSKIQNSSIQAKQKQSAGHIKLIMLSQPPNIAKQKQEYYTKLLKPKQYYCRIYILKGKSLISHYDVKPTTYLRVTYSDETINLRDTTLHEQENNPEYYICHQLPINLPGPSIVKVQVMEKHNILGRLVEKVLGYTQIDMQQRYFMKKWHLYTKKPIQLRNLYSEYGMGTQGRLQTWIDLIQKKKWLNSPAHKIHPPPFDKYQLRVIVYSTDDCVFKNIEMESNDIFVRGCIGTSQPQQTDTHWCCRSVGNFNYRFKFPVFYPPKPEDMYSDVFVIQIWDKDLVGFNNLIGQTRINLNKIHKIIQKAVKRRKPVRASMKIKQKSFKISERFWFDVYNSRQKNQFGIPEPQGRVQVGFELVPIEMAENQFKNGFGRSQPNVYPTLSQPGGRLQFDFFSPLSFIKQIIGPKLYARWCCRLICCLLIVLLGLFIFIFLPTLLAVRI